MEAIATAAVEPQRSIWSSLVEAVRGSHQDYTTASLNRAILLLAVPMILEMVLESLFAVVGCSVGGKAGSECRSHSWIDRIDVEPGFCRRHGT